MRISQHKRIKSLHFFDHIPLRQVKKGDNSLQTLQVYDRRALLVRTLSEVYFAL